MSMFFLSVHHTIPRGEFVLGYPKQILTLEALKVFDHSSIVDKAVFCLGEKQGMLVNDECSVGDFFKCHFGIGGKKFFIWQWISRQGHSKQPHSRV